MMICYPYDPLGFDGPVDAQQCTDYGAIDCSDASVDPDVVLGGATCQSPTKICSGMTFQAVVGSETDAVACLDTAPGPSWLYFEIDASGSIVLTLSAADDIDYAVFGPFSDEMDTIAACGNLQNAVDCSYSSSATEYIDIPNGQSGELYLLLVTNYAEASQMITMSIGTGSGSLKCPGPDVVLGGATCQSPTKICSGMTFQAVVGSETDAVACLDTAPGPSWLYFEIDASGSIALTLSAADDIDYAVFGPFSDEMDTIAACGNLQNAVDCSYSMFSVAE